MNSNSSIDHLHENSSSIEIEAAEAAFYIRKNLFRRDIARNIETTQKFLANNPNTKLLGINSESLKYQKIINHTFAAMHLNIKLHFAKKYDDVLFYKNKLYDYLAKNGITLYDIEETEESIDSKLALIKEYEGELYEKCLIKKTFNIIYKSVMLNNNPNKIRQLLGEVKCMDFTLMTEDEYDDFFNPIGDGKSLYSGLSIWLYNKIKHQSKYCDVSLLIDMYYLLARKCLMTIEDGEVHTLELFQKKGYIAVANTLMYKAYMFHQVKDVNMQIKNSLEFLDKAGVGIDYLDNDLSDFIGLKQAS